MAAAGQRMWAGGEAAEGVGWRPEEVAPDVSSGAEGVEPPSSVLLVGEEVEGHRGRHGNRSSAEEAAEGLTHGSAQGEGFGLLRKAGERRASGPTRSRSAPCLVEEEEEVPEWEPRARAEGAPRVQTCRRPPKEEEH